MDISGEDSFGDPNFSINVSEYVETQDPYYHSPPPPPQSGDISGSSEGSELVPGTPDWRGDLDTGDSGAEAELEEELQIEVESQEAGLFTHRLE